MRRPLVALAIAVFLCVVIGAIGYFLLVGPKKGSIDKKQKEIEQTENQIATEKSTYNQLIEIKNNVAKYEAQLAALQAKIPVEPELPSLIRSIQAAADPGTGAGVPWLSFAPSDVAAGEGGGYSTYSFTMTAGGLYDEIVDLIYRMERMTRAVVIETVSMAPTTGILEQTFSPNLGVVAVNIGAKTYTFAQPPSEAGTPAPTPTPSSAPSSSEETPE